MAISHEAVQCYLQEVIEERHKGQALHHRLRALERMIDMETVEAKSGAAELEPLLARAVMNMKRPTRDVMECALRISSRIGEAYHRAGIERD